MLPTEELFVYVYVLVHDLMLAGAIVVPRPPGTRPGLQRCRAAGHRGGPAPARPAQRVRVPGRGRPRLGAPVPGAAVPERGQPPHPLAVGRVRAAAGSSLAARLPEDDCQQVDTSALPVKHPSRVRGPDQWTGPGNDLAARFGRDAAHAEWFYGFRLAVKTDLGSRIVRAWSIVPAAVSERDVAVDLLEAGPAPRDLLADKGFSGRAFAAAQAARGTAVLVPPGKKQRAAMPSILRKVIAEWRNRIETTFSEITDQHGTGPARRPHLLGPAHQDRSHHRRPHTAPRLPQPRVTEPP